MRTDPISARLQEKVFGIGLNKTGTTSLGICLKKMGYKHLSCRRDLLEHYTKGYTESVYKVIDDYDSFEDWPYPLMYVDLFKEYPNSKFILTVRSSAEKWLRSLMEHSLYTNPFVHCRKMAYGYSYPHYAQAQHIQFYEAHNRAVVDFFKRMGAEDRLLFACWEQGHGWAELAAFLGRPAPDEPFPRARAKETRAPSGKEAINTLQMRILSLVN